MLAITTNSEGLRGQLILSPQGVALASIKSFREILEKMPELAAVEMEAIFEVLGRANYKAELEGNSKWRRAEALPEGWMKIPSESIYLSPLGAILKSKRAINEHLGYNHFKNKKRKFKEERQNKETDADRDLNPYQVLFLHFLSCLFFILPVRCVSPQFVHLFVRS